jgi:hypothetical protein
MGVGLSANPDNVLAAERAAEELGSSPPPFHTWHPPLQSFLFLFPS